MQPFQYLPILLLFVVIFYIYYRNRKAIVARRVVKNKSLEEKARMIELAKQFIGKECLIYSFDGNHQFEGVIREVVNGAVLVEKDGMLEAINLDFVIRIREFPKNKKGKKKSVVLD